MSDERVIIIGGGIAGLSMGIYLRSSGLDTEVLEMASRSGGLCVAWERKGYTFDGATNWLPGSSPRLNLHDVLAEVLDFSSLDIIEFDEFVRIEGMGESLTVYNDHRRLREEMLRLSPRDEKPIKAFTGAIARVGRLVLPIDKPPELWGPLDAVRAARTSLPAAAFAARWRNVTIAQYARRFSDPTLRHLFLQIFSRHEHFSVLGLMMSLGWMCLGSAGYPIGGSLAFADAVEARYRELGGAVRYRARVERILVEDGRAVGVELDGGEVLRGDVVVSTADLRHTVVDLLGGAYPPKRDDDLRAAKPPVFPGLVQVSFGVARDLGHIVHKSILPLDPPLSMGSDKKIPSVLVRVCHFDPTFAPRGKTAVVAHVRTHDPAWWERLRAEDRSRYRAEKTRVAQRVLDRLESRWGDIAEHVEVTDVATPATYARYTNAWHGSIQGWAPIPALVGRTRPNRLPGLAGLYLAGQWIEAGGGLPRVVLSSRNTAQVLCHDLGRPFVAPPRRSLPAS